MATYTFYTNPMSRGQIARWALHEVGADYEQVLVDWVAKPAALTRANPMAKVPTLIHHSQSGDRVITECAAICAYLAHAHPDAALLPSDAEAADYYRWMFFAAGPIEQAIVARSMGWQVPEGREAMVGFGSYERVLDTLEGHFNANMYVCGARFTMADVYVGSQVDWGLTFGSIPPRPAFVAYADRLQARDAYKAAKGIDAALIAESQK
ncbi:MAG: glutathione S-transferase family protein [Novosphingobium sp.]|uniref:glutathione S-transferase family protein n=1 Tax=Novosphingobium sp. TaxID=1874826 RepID=UPI003C7C50CE